MKTMKNLKLSIRDNEVEINYEEEKKTYVDDEADMDTHNTFANDKVRSVGIYKY